jgi:hypothetical protein
MKGSRAVSCCVPVLRQGMALAMPKTQELKRL